MDRVPEVSFVNHRRGTIRLAAAAASLLVAGCQLIGATPLGRAAAAAREHPFVVEVEHGDASIADDESLYVWIDPYASAEDVERLWCLTLVPAGADDTNTLVSSPGGSVQYSRPASCPAANGTSAT